VAVDLFGGAALSRCRQCGSRCCPAGEEPAPPRRAAAEGVQGLPRLVDGEVVEPLAESPVGGPLPDPGLAEAAENEIRRALADSWRFVSGRRSSEYLDRIARSAARNVEGAPERCRVYLHDDPRILRLALPSGRLLFSIGALRAIEDEAELVFVLGHDLAHVASGDAARRLTALGLAELARGAGGQDARGWFRAAGDLIRLGHGAENEHRADLVGVRAVLGLGYDPESVVRYLERLGRAVDDGDPRVSETTLAHPLPVDRLHRLRKSWGVHVRDVGASRVNRDAFRRAVGHSALASELETSDPLGDEARSTHEKPALPWKDWRLIGTGVAILLLAALILVLGLMLAR
jgi:predicted Zn-dependent protease